MKRIRILTDILAFTAKVFNKLYLMPLSVFLFKVKDTIVLTYLKKHYMNFISEYAPQESVPKKVFKIAPIWVCWFQGEENAPVLVKKCIESIKKNANGHDVITISDANIGEYVDIPEIVVGAANRNIISKTGYSDIVRSALLATYGGLWIDATFFITKKIPNEYFSYPLFSAAKQPEPKNRRGVCISRFRWTSSFIGSSHPNHKLFCFLRDFFYNYIEMDGIFIDYLLFDYVTYLAYINFEDIREDILNIPDNNIDFGWLFHVMDLPYDEEKEKKMFSTDTIAYKLSYKKRWKLYSKGKKTFYNVFLNGNKI